MTPPSPPPGCGRTALLTAATTLAFLLTGCAATAQQAAPAATTWAIPTAAPTTSQPEVPTTETPTSGVPDPTIPTPAAQGEDPALSPVDSPGQNDTTAQPSDQLLNPTFDLDHIDRTDPTQVTWAYLTHRLTYSHTDPAPAAGITQATQYAAPDLTANLAQTAQLATDTWPDVQAAQTDATATITSLTTFAAATQVSVIATWTLTVTAADCSRRSTAGLNTTVVLGSATAGEWRVVTDNLSRPD